MNTQDCVSLVLITKNASSTLARTLESAASLVQEIVVIDDMSTDDTPAIAGRFGAKVYRIPESHEGRQRALSLKYATYDWILSLDSDEVVSPELAAEIKDVLGHAGSGHDGYKMVFRNHFLGKPVTRGGETYSMLRLFRKSKVRVDDTPIHSQFHLKRGEPGTLRNRLDHYSYRSIGQVLRKFTAYARREARKKAALGEQTDLKRLTMYPLHMFWARFVEDNGYRDGFHRIPLDMAFAYMEFMTYWYLLWERKRN
ncbi:MAG: glycosyltransferase family 2 protein [Patescibacteria group bacterium]|nr:glycosyltransferase family 2 protein [Patescibacteria group bacterium]